MKLSLWIQKIQIQINIQYTLQEYIIYIDSPYSKNIQFLQIIGIYARSTCEFSFPKNSFFALSDSELQPKKIGCALWDPKPLLPQTALNNPNPHIFFFSWFSSCKSEIFNFNDIDQLFLFGCEFSAYIANFVG